MSALKTLIFIITFFILSNLYAYPVKFLAPRVEPQVKQLCTVSDPDFYEFRYAEKIPYCQRNVSSTLKAKIYLKYGISAEEKIDYTIDHIIPLSIGGTNDESNLWPEHTDVKKTRLLLEQQLYWDLRKGKITQKEAIRKVLDVKHRTLP